MPVHVLAAGSARGLLAAVAPALGEATGAALQVATAGPATLRRRLSRGTAADLVILPLGIVEALAREGRVDPGSITLVGVAELGLAVRIGDPAPDVSHEDAIADALVDAEEIHLADPEEAGAGRTVRALLDALEIGEDVAASLRHRSDGIAAMEALALAEAGLAVGCAEIPEILAVCEVCLVGPLPQDLAPATPYAAAVPTIAVEAAAARAAIALLTSRAAAEARARCGLGRP